MSRYYLPNSATVRSDVATLVTNYGNTTTDHYPVFTQFSYTQPDTGAILPPLTFTAVRQGNTGLLKWTTTPENNARVFEVQKSLDGRLFLPIGLVQAKSSNSTDPSTDYSFTDPLPLAGTNYYRLREIVALGNSTLSNTVSLTFAPPLTVTAVPNPAIGFTALIVAHADGPYIIQILNSSGNVVKQQSGLPGSPVNTVGLGGLRGIYTVKVITASSIATTKLLVL